MKVLLINGSPHKEGCTYTALKEVADTLEANGIKTEMMYLGVKPIAGCIACGNCQKKKPGNVLLMTVLMNSLQSCRK